MEGLTAIVTGAGRGLGKAIALEFSRAGANVGLIDLDRDSLDDVGNVIAEGGGRSSLRLCDVSDRKEFHLACEALCGEFGQLDALVNNAMWTRYEPLENISEESLERTLAVGAKSVIWGAQALLKLASSVRGAALINLTSATASLGFRNAASYSAAKGAVAAVTRQLAIELGPRHIRVNAILPGPIPTPGGAAVVDEDGWRRRKDRTPLGHLGEPSDVGQAAVFLASPAGRFMTGQILTVDGGFTVAGP